VVSIDPNARRLYAASDGRIVSLRITAGGSGYSDASGVALTYGGGGAGATASITTSAGVVTGITIDAPGLGYATNDGLTITGGDGLATVEVVGTVGPVVLDWSGNETIVKNGSTGRVDLWSPDDSTNCLVLHSLGGLAANPALQVFGNAIFEAITVGNNPSSLDNGSITTDGSGNLSAASMLPANGVTQDVDAAFLATHTLHFVNGILTSVT